MATAKPGDTVQIHYTGTLDDGSQFDSSAGREPLEFTLGSGQVIPGFDAAVTGLEVGESRTVRIEPEDAYGEVDDRLVQQVDRKQLPAHIPVEKGLQLQAGRPGANPMIVTVVDFDDDTVTLDGNHELAGKALTFAVELVRIV
ncbi:MAG: peptidylprolyl isomerase [Sphingomonadales bacterium]